MTENDPARDLAAEEARRFASAALVSALGALKNIAPNSTNSETNSRFADLAAVRDAIVPVLAQHGFAVLQDLQTIGSDNAPRVVTTFLHCNGRKFSFGPFYIPPDRTDGHGYAAATTWARRVALLAAAGIAVESGDDPAPARATDAARISPEQVQQLTKLLPPTPIERARFLAFIGVDSLAEISAARFEFAAEWLTAKREKKAARKKGRG